MSTPLRPRETSRGRLLKPLRLPSHIDAPSPNLAAIALGSNLASHVGDPAATIKSALESLAALPGVALRCASSLYVTKAVSTVPQPDFVNAAAIITTTRSPRELLDALLAIERAHGRERAGPPRSDPQPSSADPATIHPWMARTLDLDLILFAQRIIDEPGLTVPHPRLHLRRFVLAPLAEIAPDLAVPPSGRTVLELLRALPPQ